jgi:ATP-dependent exoDNAse (exonuclease V) beta subunit
MTPMSEPLQDQPARDRFRDAWDRNFAVSANAGSGKTTAISERLAAIALAPGAEERLRKTAVVTFTKKAAAQIAQRARTVLLRRLAGRPDGGGGLAALDHLERAFFGTIHSFCLLLAQRHGQTLGIHLNPAVITDEDDAWWEEFLEQDGMQFGALTPAQIDAFLRHTPLESIFGLARQLDASSARQFVRRIPDGGPPTPDRAVLDEILAATTRRGKGAEALRRNQETAVEWRRRFDAETSYLPLPKPVGRAAGIDRLFARFFAPLKGWLAAAGAVMAAELALRYRAWRFDHGVQTYADQVEAALTVLRDGEVLERIRAEQWRVILDEAQDTDDEQFTVLVEITRPPGARLGTWPTGGGPGPRPGHFCFVGDGQQAIYGDRADIRNFQRHLDALGREDGGEQLKFDVTFRAPHRVITLLNATLPGAFSAAREHNCGLPPADGAPAPLLQVPYDPLVAGPENVPGFLGVVPLVPVGKISVAARLAAEVRQVAAFLRAHGPAGVGARHWGEVCLLAPRNDWLVTARKELEASGLKVALQMRRNRNGDNPVYAWIGGLLAAVCDPDNAFEWTGALREVFAVSDAVLADALRAEHGFHWDEPERHPEPLRRALAALKPFVERVDLPGEPLERFAADLARAGGLAAKARRIDPGGALTGELERLLAQAAELGLTGAGPREWRQELLAAIDDGRPAGKPSDEALNLLTAHSAKGLEWPVVIPLGLWRGIGRRPESGLRLVPGPARSAAVYYDGESMPEETKHARERERLRELVRLLYVTLTRPRRALVLPWGPEFAPADPESFAGLWGAPLAEIGPLRIAAEELRELPAAAVPAAVLPVAERPRAAKRAPVVLPARILPHQLAESPDPSRASRHESGLDEPPGGTLGDDPIDYGLWWHETMEFLPWDGDDAAVDHHLAGALARAQRAGMGSRAAEEIATLRAGEFYRRLRSSPARRLAELAVFAPLRPGAWIDGVIDLVVHDPVARTVRVIDWKTNRRRPGEEAHALLERLSATYRPQLAAYGACVAGFFPGCAISLELYASALGAGVVLVGI